MVNTLFVWLCLAVAIPLARADEPVVQLTPFLMARSGDTLSVVIEARISEGWHLYWKHPGDSGLPPEFTLQLPDGWQLLDIAWPRPVRLDSEAGTSFILDELSHFVFRLLAPGDATREAGVDVDWLACREACVPGISSTTIVPAELQPVSRRQRKLIQRALPLESPPGLRASQRADSLFLELPPGSLPLFSRVTAILPEAEPELDWGQALHVSRQGGTLLLGQSLTSWSDARPERLTGLLLLCGPLGKHRAINLDLKLNKPAN